MSTDRVEGWVRRVVAGLVLLLGGVDLALAAAGRPVPRAGLFAVAYPVSVVGGARYLLLAAGLTAVLVSRGLSHGRRPAWWAALVAAGVSLPGHHLRGGDLVGMLVAALALAALVGAARLFAARADPVLLRRGVGVLVAGELAVLGYAVVGLYWLHLEPPETGRAAWAVRDALRLLFLLPTEAAPTTHHGHWFVGSVRVAALVVAIVGLSRLVAAVLGEPGQHRDRDRVRRLLDAWATDSLAYFHLLPDKNWVFSADGDAFVGYAVVGTAAVALAGPVGAPGSRRQAAAEFHRMCVRNGWTPVFHQVDEADRVELAAAGWKFLTIGEEAVLDLTTWTLDGRPRKGLRSALRRCERAGYRVVDLAQPIDESTMEQLAAVSDSWLAAGGHRERRFTVGRFDPAYLRDTRVVAVCDAAGTVQAFANILPAFQSTVATFDLMRRRPDSVNGTMDLLFVGMVDRLRAAGFTGMSLGLAPLSGTAEPTGVADRALRLLHDYGERVFHFAGLRAFKAKWSPRWVPRYLAYRSEADLVRAASAVARVGELVDPRGPLGRAVALLRRFPVTAAFAAVELWLMVVTALDVRVQGALLARFGVSWHALAAGRVWVLVTSPLVPAEPGLLWSNLVLLLVVLPLAEWRVGSRAVPVVFFLGDWAGTLPTVLCAHLAALAGVAGAAELASVPTAGSSAGSVALAAAVLWTLPAGWPRRVGVAGLLVVLLARVLLAGHLFDVQHLVSALAVLAALAVRDTRAARTTRPG
ncbi:bifunctional lysylphosphatidylglycerol flippase/synthetase MprF [Goodfellowiella coeruleoviolacea]|uniref:Phosphatidylglycerol lysyltransferase n=1 Tax=Goodfellowiella coeruleoviolacea TaxID=334858 RepID=A0AAE3KM59_9PSEU|nr:phosphatidylglycerol lysyltransferase domain-containing protein [Goodfellowiella coeruleoviolacea]MCP2167213.1 phosphatidylglycerol lysyltransferase [Goodfellowiella coeruleoviolacea]